jgi:hypothetical protein
MIAKAGSESAGMAPAPDEFDALYEAALRASSENRPQDAERLMAQAETIRPEIRHFGHMAGLLRQRGKGDWRSLHAARLEEYRRLSGVDGLIISYPKCGRTWLRAMLGQYLLNGIPGDPLELEEICRADRSLPKLLISHDDFPHWKPWTEIVADKSLYKGKRILFLVREPKDTLVSYYFQYTKRGDQKHANDKGFSGSLSDFLRHPIGGLRSLVAFYNAWARARTAPAAFMLLRYEALQADPLASFTELLRFFKLPDHGADAVGEAVGFGRFDNLRALEQNDSFFNWRLSPPADGDPEGYKIRRGKVGGFRDYLSGADIAYVDDYLRDTLDDYYAFYKPSR